MSITTYSAIPEVNAACMRSAAEGHTLTRDMVFVLETVFKINLTYEDVTEIFSAAAEYRAAKEKLIEEYNDMPADIFAEMLRPLYAAYERRCKEIFSRKKV